MAISTRHRIIVEWRKAIEALDRCLGHLQGIDTIADGRAHYVNEAFPALVTSLEFCREVLVKIRAEL